MYLHTTILTAGCLHCQIFIPCLLSFYFLGHSNQTSSSFVNMPSVWLRMKIFATWLLVYSTEVSQASTPLSPSTTCVTSRGWYVLSSLGDLHNDLYSTTIICSDVNELYLNYLLVCVSSLPSLSTPTGSWVLRSSLWLSRRFIQTTRRWWECFHHPLFTASMSNTQRQFQDFFFLF